MKSEYLNVSGVHLIDNDTIEYQGKHYNIQDVQEYLTWRYEEEVEEPDYNSFKKWISDNAKEMYDVLTILDSKVEPSPMEDTIHNLTEDELFEVASSYVSDNHLPKIVKDSNGYSTVNGYGVSETFNSVLDKFSEYDLVSHIMSTDKFDKMIEDANGRQAIATEEDKKKIIKLVAKSIGYKIDKVSDDDYKAVYNELMKQFKLGKNGDKDINQRKFYKRYTNLTKKAITKSSLNFFEKSIKSFKSKEAKIFCEKIFGNDIPKEVAAKALEYIGGNYSFLTFKSFCENIVNESKKKSEEKAKTKTEETQKPETVSEPETPIDNSKNVSAITLRIFNELKIEQKNFADETDALVYLFKIIKEDTYCSDQFLINLRKFIRQASDPEGGYYYSKKENQDQYISDLVNFYTDKAKNTKIISSTLDTFVQNFLFMKTKAFKTKFSVDLHSEFKYSVFDRNAIIKFMRFLKDDDGKNPINVSKFKELANNNTEFLKLICQVITNNSLQIEPEEFKKKVVVKFPDVFKNVSSSPQTSTAGGENTEGKSEEASEDTTEE